MLDKNNKPYPDDVATAIEIARKATALYKRIKAASSELNQLANATYSWDVTTTSKVRAADSKFTEAVESFKAVAEEKHTAAVKAITYYEAGQIIFPPPAPTTEKINVINRDELLAAWDCAVDDLTARIRQGVKAKMRDVLECGALNENDQVGAVGFRPYYWPRIILYLYVLDQSEPPDAWADDVRKLKPFV